MSGDDEARHVYYYALLPNMLLNLHPDYMRYRPGPYSNREELLLGLDRFVLERLEGRGSKAHLVPGR